ncbi:MAG: pentapeptide repeat-containing protein [Leptolyngbyaceae cyanobacterium]
MANPEHVAKLKEGVEAWNQWRGKNPKVWPDLSSAKLNHAKLSYAKLGYANLSDADLSSAKLSYANLSDADLRNTNLYNANLYRAALRGAHLSNADLRSANLNGAVLSYASLSGANLSYANLSDTNLSDAIFNRTSLSHANLRGAHLSYASLRGADLSHTNLYSAQVLYTSFQNAILTAACIADWQINGSTNLAGIKCDYIFRSYDSKERKFTGRLPVNPESMFASGEFTQRFQIIASALETIDITFTEGIDWQAFFTSFQELRQQYPAQNIAVQGMEEKGGAFVVRLKVEAEETGPELEQLKGAIETAQKQLYSTQLALSAAQGENKVFREMMGVVKSLADKPMGDQNFYGPVGNVAGNVAGNNYGNMKATIHSNYGSKADDILRLLTALRESAQAFPKTQIEEVHIHLDDLANDLQQEKPQTARLRTRLVALLGVAIALGTHIATATDFANNVLELSQKLSVPAQALEPQLQQLKDIHPDFEWTPTE